VTSLIGVAPRLERRGRVHDLLREPAPQSVPPCAFTRRDGRGSPAVLGHTVNVRPASAEVPGFFVLRSPPRHRSVGGTALLRRGAPPGGPGTGASTATEGADVLRSRADDPDELHARDVAFVWPRRAGSCALRSGTRARARRMAQRGNGSGD